MYRRMIPLVFSVLFAAGAVNAPEAEANNVLIEIDAEELSWTAPMEVATDPNALGGKYVVVAKGTRNIVSGSTSVQLPSAGDYYLWVRVRAPSASARWFAIEIGGARYAWPTASPTDWHWERVSHIDRSGAAKTAVVSVLTPGAYALKVSEGKDGTSLDAVLITDDAYYVPVDHCHR